MITHTSGDILQDSSEALVNTVNCVGVMGLGLALQFKNAFPENFAAYKIACIAGEVTAGKMFITRTGRIFPSKLIVNFPTKRHWRDCSRMDDIQDGLVDLRNQIQSLQIGSIAIPALGCDLGGLDWTDVCPVIESTLADVKAEVILYAPHNSSVNKSATS